MEDDAQIEVTVRQLGVGGHGLLQFGPGFLVHIEVEVGLTHQQVHVGRVASRAHQLREGLL